MEPFTRVTAVGLPIDLPNVDTDRVIPARFLRKDRSVPEYSSFLFHDVRFGADGAERPEFILNQAAYRAARIVVAAENFGCGSSREAAVWALAAYGFRSVIAPSLGDIFHQNSFKNGLLPVILPADVVAGLRRQLHDRPGAMLTVDLEAQTVTAPDGALHRFEVDAFRKEMLLTGRDEIGLTRKLRREDSRVRGAPRAGDGVGRPPAREQLIPGGRVMTTLTVEYPKDLLKLVGRELGPSEWVTVDQAMIDKFAEATGDHQWIHVDVERAKREMPGGKTIAHGYLTLSLVPRMASTLLEVKKRSRGINYGSNKVRFISPVQAGARIRVRQRITGAEEVAGNGVRVSSEMTVEIEGHEKPALVGEIIGVRYA